MTHEHDPVVTGYVQTSYFNTEKNEQEEFKCQDCKKVWWVPRGTTPNIKRQSLPKASAAHANQLKLHL